MNQGQPESMLAPSREDEWNPTNNAGQGTVIPSNAPAAASNCSPVLEETLKEFVVPEPEVTELLSPSQEIMKNSGTTFENTGTTLNEEGAVAAREDSCNNASTLWFSPRWTENGSPVCHTAPARTSLTAEEESLSPRMETIRRAVSPHDLRGGQPEKVTEDHLDLGAYIQEKDKRRQYGTLSDISPTVKSSVTDLDSPQQTLPLSGSHSYAVTGSPAEGLEALSPEWSMQATAGCVSPPSEPSDPRCEICLQHTHTRDSNDSSMIQSKLHFSDSPHAFPEEDVICQDESDCVAQLQDPLRTPTRPLSPQDLNFLGPVFHRAPAIPTRQHRDDNALSPFSSSSSDASESPLGMQEIPQKAAAASKVYRRSLIDDSGDDGFEDRLQPLTSANDELDSPRTRAVNQAKARVAMEAINYKGERPAASVQDTELENHKKNRIFIIAKGQRVPVAWYLGTMSKADIKAMILCACDAIADRGVLLREIVDITEDEETLSRLRSKEEDARGGRLAQVEVEGTMRTFVKGSVLAFEDFDRLRDGCTYLLEAGAERQDLVDITGDRWRRLRVPIKPLLHVEAQKAVDRMKNGTNLLKHTRFGYPHLRQFQLSSDCQRLLWYSSKKNTQSSCVHLDAVVEVRLGQQSKNFNAYKLVMLEHLSFGIVYGPQRHSLDLTAKDEVEFDYWVTGLKALVLAARGLEVGKEDLLKHSLRFQKALTDEGASANLMKCTQPVKTLSLGDCIDLPVHSLEDLEKKYNRLVGRHSNLYEKIKDSGKVLNASRSPDTNYSLPEGSFLGDMPPGTPQKDWLEEDMELECLRMWELLDLSKDLLMQAATELDAAKVLREDRVRSQLRSHISVVNSPPKDRTPKDLSIPPNTPSEAEIHKLKVINQNLWKCEVDLENIDDMYSRINSPKVSAYWESTKEKLNDINKTINSELSRITAKIESSLNDLLLLGNTEVLQSTTDSSEGGMNTFVGTRLQSTCQNDSGIGWYRTPGEGSKPTVQPSISALPTANRLPT